MTDDFVPSNPEFTVSFTGPQGKEYIGVWKKHGKRGEFWSGKDARGNYVTINKFESKEDRQKRMGGQQPEPQQDSDW